MPRENMKNILIIDGSNLLFQMFYGMPARIKNSDGKSIHGTIGFVGGVLKILRLVKPTHVFVVFDGECENIRKQIDTEYKANRPDYSEIPYDEQPFSQLSDIYAALDIMGIKFFETTVCESDDIIASYAIEYGNEYRVMICSQDSDFFGLVNDNVSVLRYRGDKTEVYDPEKVREKLGILPILYADYKCLTGDKADNIKGADKIGPKTAAMLVNEYGSLENIILYVDSIKKPSVRESVKNSAERLRKNYKLIRLSGGQELPFDIDKLEYSYNGVTTGEILRSIGLR